MFILVILIYLSLIIYEFMPLYAERQWRDFGLNAFLALSSFSMAMLLALGIEISSPELIIREFFISILGK